MLRRRIGMYSVGAANVCSTQHRGAKIPFDGAMHKPGLGADDEDGNDIPTGETWSQAAAKQRFGRRRVRVASMSSQIGAEFYHLRKMCRMKPALRQFFVRDNFCKMNLGTVVMSPSMQAAFMRVYRSRPKQEVRACLREIIPILNYRNYEEKSFLNQETAEEVIPEDQPFSLNRKKTEMYEKFDGPSAFSQHRMMDRRAHHQLKWNIKMKLMKFQKKIAVANAAASRTVMYSEEDALGYLLFRGPCMYAASLRVLFELAKQLPWFVPKSMLDFGSGTGTAILAAKEIYDPGSMAHPLARESRSTLTKAESAKSWAMGELKYDLQRLERNNSEIKKARFMAVSALIENGELDMKDIPKDLRKEIVEVASSAHRASKERMRREARRRQAHVVSGFEWSEKGNEEEPEDVGEFPGENDSEADEGNNPTDDKQKTWWEKYVDQEEERASRRASQRLKPLQSIVAIEPSPGMMQTAVVVLNEDVPNVTWKRFLLPEDETQQHDLVIAAYTLSEIASKEGRKRAVEQLWKVTKGVLVLIEFASIPAFDLMMEARDQLLEQKGVGLWDWQPTILAPCPHEKRCPIRHCRAGIRLKGEYRVCKTEVRTKATFIDKWAEQIPLLSVCEPISYLIVARNELVPDRIEQRKKEVAKENAAKVMEREDKQQELHKEALAVDDVLHERISEEVLQKPETAFGVGIPQGKEIDAKATTPNPNVVKDHHSRENPPTKWISLGNQRFNKLIFPEKLTVPEHKYNRLPFMSSSYQGQRVVSPSEMMVIKSEIDGVEREFLKRASQYLRIVKKPSEKKVRADFCTPEGELLRARVHRDYHGPDGPNSPKYDDRNNWRCVGGFLLLRHSATGDLFPSDVPLFSVTRFDQLESPNTMVNHTMSSLESVGVQYDTIVDGTRFQKPEDEMTMEEAKEYRKFRQTQEEREEGEAALGSIFNVKTGLTPKQELDARASITAEEWSRAVRTAKRRMKSSPCTPGVRQVMIPFSARTRKFNKLASRGQQPFAKVIKSKQVNHPLPSDGRSMDSVFSDQ